MEVKMELGICPYCELPGLLLSVKSVSGGLEVSGRCLTCGYTCDSDYASADVADDLSCEYENYLPDEVRAQD